MPAGSRRIEEEGVLIDNWLLVSGGRLREAGTRALLGGAAYPSRNPAANLADLRAQVAANEKGAAELRRIVAQYGLDVVHAYVSGALYGALGVMAEGSGTMNDVTFGNDVTSGGHVH